MLFENAAEIDSVCWQMRESDWVRGSNRARIDQLFNGVPPYSAQEVQDNRIAVNFNDLTGTRAAHDARSQFNGAFLKPGNYFKSRTDWGPVHNREKYNAIITKERTKIMKRSLDYYECFRSKFASDVLHGIGPYGWCDRDKWCPEMIAIEDVMVPSQTLLTMKNLPFFALYHSWTAPELIRMTRGPKLDPGWNMDLVQKCIEWVDRETLALMGTNWPEIWSPEKQQERVKGDGGWYSGDQVPTIDVWDFYCWHDDGKDSGWYRRIILDAWSSPGNMGYAYEFTQSKPPKLTKRTEAHVSEGQGQFLYYGGKKKFAEKREQIVGFQFADLSAVAPFRYHSVRSLGFFLYGACTIQNRLRCKFNESVFEALLMYFRVRSSDEAERALKLDMVNRGFIDETLQFVPAAERWQVNSALVELGLRENQQLIQDNSSSYLQQTNFSKDRTEKTKFQVMAEVNAMTSLVGAALNQAYSYQTFEYNEIARRFFKKNSSDPDVREFQAACLKQGVPEKLMVPEAWENEPERVMGAGNKTLEMAISEQLMAMRSLFDPGPQRQILRDVTLAITDDPARSEALVPELPNPSNSAHDAQLAMGALMQGLPVGMKDGINESEYIETVLADIGMVVQQGNQSGGMLPPDKIAGLQNAAQHVQQHIAKLAQDKTSQEKVREYGKVLGQLMNYVKAFAQRLQQQMQARNGQQGGGMDPKDAARIQATQATAQAKIQNMKQSHAQRTAQRKIQFEQELQLDREKHRHEVAKEKTEMLADVQAKDLEAAGNIRRNRLKSIGE